MMESIKDYFFKGVIFPKRVLINMPGAIINQLSQRYGGPKSKHRTVYYFEDISVALQKVTIKKLGGKKAKDLHFSIGRYGMKRYLLHGEHKKVPEFLMPSLLDYMLKGFVSAGYSSAIDYDYNPKKKELILRGCGNIVCRKSNCPEQFCGGLTVLMESFLGGSFNAKVMCSFKDHKCCLIISPSSEKRANENFIDVSIEKDYKKLNFPKMKTIDSRFSSIGDFIKFKKIYFSKDGKACFKNKTIGSLPYDFFGIISEYYRKIGETDLLRLTISEESKKIMDDILKNEPKDKKINIVISIICAFGFGIPHIKRSKNKIELKLLYPPIDKFDFDYNSSVFWGFLESALNLNLKFSNTLLKKYDPSITLTYNILQ